MKTKIELNGFKAEMKADLKKIEILLNLCNNKTLAMELYIGGIHKYSVERNKNVICMLKKERKTLRRKLKRFKS
jgi:hypothetical protein